MRQGLLLTLCANAAAYIPTAPRNWEPSSADVAQKKSNVCQACLPIFEHGVGERDILPHDRRHDSLAWQAMTHDCFAAMAGACQYDPGDVDPAQSLFVERTLREFAFCTGFTARERAQVSIGALMRITQWWVSRRGCAPDGPTTMLMPRHQRRVSSGCAAFCIGACEHRVQLRPPHVEAKLQRNRRAQSGQLHATTRWERRNRRQKNLWRRTSQSFRSTQCLPRVCWPWKMLKRRRRRTASKRLSG